MPIRVLVADDHPIIAEGISAILRASEGEIVALVTKVEDLASKIQTTSPDVVVMEARIGGTDALKSLESISETFSTKKIVIFSAHTHTSHIARASALGCHEFLTKSAPLSQLLLAIQRAAAGSPTPETSLLATTRSNMRGSASGGADAAHPLTNREMQVLRHVAMGLSNREVGRALGISVETVKEHVQNILRKLNVNDRTQAAVWAVRGGFI